jgi:hypothetical protein
LFSFGLFSFLQGVKVQFISININERISFIWYNYNYLKTEFFHLIGDEILNGLNIIIIVVPITLVVITTLIFSRIYKEKEKVDKGFELIYFKLTHRRKMLRAFTSLPIIIIGLIIIYYLSDWSLAFLIIFVLLVVLALSIEFIYNFKKWKNEEKG